MEKFIPYEKLSKKEKRKLNRARRQTWGAMSPVTRKPVSSRAYNRKKAQDWKKDIPGSARCTWGESPITNDEAIQNMTPEKLADLLDQVYLAGLNIRKDLGFAKNPKPFLVLPTCKIWFLQLFWETERPAKLISGAEWSLERGYTLCILALWFGNETNFRYCFWLLLKKPFMDNRTNRIIRI